MAKIGTLVILVIVYIETNFKISDDNHPLYKLQTAAASSFDNDTHIAEDVDITTRKGIASNVFDDLRLWLATYDRLVPNHVISDDGKRSAVYLARKYGIQNFNPTYN